jgi:hypothetical protein
MTDQITTPEDAKNALIAVPPQLVEEVQNNPEVLVHLSRAQLMLVQHKLTDQYLKDKEALVSQGVAIAEQLRKTANLEPKNIGPTPGAGFSITINIPAMGEAKEVTIEATAPRVVPLEIEDAEEVEEVEE